jgi:hypothetical protein
LSGRDASDGSLAVRARDGTELVVANTKKKTKKMTMPVPEVTFLGSVAYDIATRDG